MTLDLVERGVLTMPMDYGCRKGPCFEAPVACNSLQHAHHVPCRNKDGLDERVIGSQIYCCYQHNKQCKLRKRRLQNKPYPLAILATILSSCCITSTMPTSKTPLLLQRSISLLLNKQSRIIRFLCQSQTPFHTLV